MESEDNDKCSVVGCKNKQKNSKLCFFTFPREVERQTVWLRLIGRNDLINKINVWECDLRVCCKHFTKASKSEVIVRKLLPEAVPTKFLPTSPKLGIHHYEQDEGISDVSTQTEITYGYDHKPEKDVYVTVGGKKVLIKKEKDPEIPKLNTFVLEKPLKREHDEMKPGEEIEASVEIEPAVEIVPEIDMEPSTSKKMRY